MGNMSKAISPLISYVLVIAIAFTAISLVMIALNQVVQRMTQSAVLNEGLNNMNVLGDTITEVASEGLGSKRTILLSVMGGGYYANSTLGALYFDYSLKPGFLPSNMFTKQGNVYVLTCQPKGTPTLELRVNSKYINIAGDDNTIGKGTNTICIQKVNETNMPVVNVTRCS